MKSPMISGYRPVPSSTRRLRYEVKEGPPAPGEILKNYVKQPQSYGEDPNHPALGDNT